MNVVRSKRFIPSVRLLAGIAVVAACALPVVDAQAVQLANTSTSCGLHTLQPTQNCVNQYVDGTRTVETASLIDLTASSRMDSSAPNNHVAYAGVQYFMQLVSATGLFDPSGVPIIFTANGNTVVDGAANPGNFASAHVYFDSWFFEACSGCDYAHGTNPHYLDPASFSVDEMLVLHPDQSPTGGTYRISVSTEAHATGGAPGSFAYAFADPTIRLDTAYALAHPEYSLVFSPNVTLHAVAPVPEPETWLLVSAGIAALTWRRRVSSRKG